MMMEMDYSQIQQDEILVLESIYADAITRLPSIPRSDGRTLAIKLDIHLPSSSRFSCKHIHTGVSVPITTPTLPPLLVNVFLPPTYPGKSAPVCEGIFTYVSDKKEGREEEEECYLPTGTVRSITHKLRDLWRENGGIERATTTTTTTTDEEEADEGGAEGEGVLWSWLDWIGTGAFLDKGSTVQSLESETEAATITKDAQGVYVIPTRDVQTLHSLLRSHLISCTTATFNAQVFPCGICFDTKKGRKCVSLPCSLVASNTNDDTSTPSTNCVFCAECLRECWSLAINEGTIDSVACPGWECVKGRVKAQQRRQEEVQPVAAAEGETTRGKSQIEESKEGESGAGEKEIQLELVREVVGAELAERYQWLKEKKRVENGELSFLVSHKPVLLARALTWHAETFLEDPTYTMCPLQHCQSPVPPPPCATSTRPIAVIKTARIFRLHQPSQQTAETDKAAQEAAAAAEKRRVQAEEDLADRFRQCPTCQFSFCRFCNKTWHGTSPCPLPATASFLTSYMATPENSPAREAYEKRYGKKQLTRMVAEWVEQRANADWFDKHTRACAGCGTRVNKSAGCNHMICSKCAAHFCYRCGTKLRPADPYHHYRTPGSSCFEKLFDADEIARFEREIVGDPAALEGGFEDELAFGMGVEVDGWVGDVFPLQGNGGWW